MDTKDIFNIKDGELRGLKKSCGDFDPSMKELIIPEGVTSIEYDYKMDEKCRFIKRIVLPSTLRELEDGCFFGFKSLEEVVIPEGVTHIDKKAFAETRLRRVFIPKSVTGIDENPFYGCTRLESIVVDKDNPVYTSCNGANVIVDKRNGEVVTGCKNSVIPPEGVVIGRSAFRELGFSSFEIPSWITSIDGCAFMGCWNLISIVIPKSVEHMEYGVLADCISLESIEVEKGNRYFTSCNGSNVIVRKKGKELLSVCKNSKIPSDIKAIGNFAFFGCNWLVFAEIPPSVMTIGAMAFYQCRNLLEANIPEGVTWIQQQAFEECRSLRMVNIPKSIQIIDGCFEGCDRLSNILFHGKRMPDADRYLIKGLPSIYTAEYNHEKKKFYWDWNYHFLES